MEDKEKIIDQAVKLISTNLGQSAGEMYRKFYLEREPAEIKESVGQILTELLGEKNAARHLKKLKNNGQSI